QDADGKSLLSNTLILYTSEIGDGDAHNQENKPILLIGQLGGAIKTGQHIEFPKGAGGDFKPCDESSKTGCTQPQVADLYITIMQSMGLKASTFGSSGKSPLTLG